MTRRLAALAAAAAALAPATAFAQAAPTSLSARLGGLALIACAPLLVTVVPALAAVAGRGVGLFLWLVLTSAGGTLGVWAFQGAALGEWWQLPMLVVASIVFAVAAQLSLGAIDRARPERKSRAQHDAPA